MDYLRLGELRLAMLDGVTGFEETAGYNYATQERCSGKPGLQGIGETLSQITLNIGLRAAMGHNIAQVLETIDGLRRTGTPQLLVFADGIYKGNYVITERTNTILRTSGVGSIREADLTLSLLEYTERSVVNMRNTETRPANETTNRKITTR
ncbi:MAG: phage tail protein [Alistipes sp.]|nr:phage tail protein [Alistipes sp.]